MARKEVSFYCEICGKRFSRIEVAEDCENSHYKVEEITKVKYDSFEDKKSLYPLSLTVKLKDSKGNEKTVNYVRKQ